MTIQNFVRQNRAALDEYIGERLSFVPKTASCHCPQSGRDHFHARPRLNDSERKEWIRNDESLYRWARSEGVRM